MSDNETASGNAKREVVIVDGRLQSSDLFRHGKELTIIHERAEYKLRLTGNGKLILTK